MKLFFFMILAFCLPQVDNTEEEWEQIFEGLNKIYIVNEKCVSLPKNVYLNDTGLPPQK